MAILHIASNRVVSRTINGIVTSYAYDGWNLIEDYDASGNELVRYVHGPQSDDILAKISPTGAVYYIQDGNHNVTTITDSTGSVVERYSYDVYGAATITDASGNTLTVSGVGNRFLFTGREYLAEIGIYDYRNRVYSANLGRFLQTDPIRFEAGDINIYRYVGNGPVNGRDPLGLCMITGSENLSISNGQTTFETTNSVTVNTGGGLSLSGENGYNSQNGVTGYNVGASYTNNSVSANGTINMSQNGNVTGGSGSVSLSSGSGTANVSGQASTNGGSVQGSVTVPIGNSTTISISGGATNSGGKTSAGGGISFGGSF